MQESRRWLGTGDDQDGYDARRATWADIAWLKSVTTLPILVKGVLSPQDAVLAIQAGASGVIVSNHGGRALDGSLSSIESLGPVVQAVRSLPTGAGIPVLLDSGVRRGTDVLKALALGATAVLLGRPMFFALAVGGQDGVQRMLSIIKDELEAAMALCGCQRLQDITRDMVTDSRRDGSTFHRARL
eukprot:g12775.t1